ncbi:MAG TPA: family 78 glycoside hydrolase catalytic domain [Bacteroidales bacterium]|nr:family 78 glycoside hydrolase catalytic domain [Bacteroidales bacterium]
MARNPEFKKIMAAGLVLAFILSSCTGPDKRFSAVNLRCEYLQNPIGIDSQKPRLTWQMADGRMGSTQSTFQVFVGTDSSKVAAGKADKWDSGEIRSDLNLVHYSGGDLKPFTKYFWSVRIRDGRGRVSGISETASFETGMMKESNWKGSWIGDSHDTGLKPAPYFRKSFTVSGKVNRARVYIAVAGLYELYINGHPVGDHRLDPAFTRFDRCILYNVYDVSRFIQDGENVIGVLLGNGWYNHQSSAVWSFDAAPWRGRPKFCLDLNIESADGTCTSIVTGTGWKTSLSPVVFNSIYTGEHYDARLEQPGWNCPGFIDTAWNDIILVAAPSRKIVSQVMHPIRITETIPAKSVTRQDIHTWMFDLGRNIAGVSSLTVSGAAGTVIRLRHAERLTQNGLADQSNIDVHYRPKDKSDPFQTDIFILSGKGKETFMPRFNYKGFRYVEVSSDKPLNLDIESLKGHFMHSDVPIAGTIESSESLLGKIWQATNNSYLSNLYGYPTDCPQREKNGWTGDAHIAIETGLYNFDGITVYEKWLNDHLDEQQPNGVLPAIIPTGGWGYHWANGPDWTSTIAIIPWYIYLFYGDDQLLYNCYESIRNYVDHIDRISPSGLTDWGLGDWIPVKSVASKELTSSVYYYTDALILSKAAQLFGKAEDHRKYLSLANRIRDAINARYLDRETDCYGQGFQTELSLPLFWGIVPEEIRTRVADTLAGTVKAANNTLDVGILGSKAILNALSENGYPDLAYSMAVKDTYPSWGWWIRNGATTLYENWDIDPRSDISMNHIMFGEISAWMYKTPGGIYPDEKQPGFRNVILKPCFVNGLDHFEARHNGPYGMIISSWRREGPEIVYDVTVPPGSTANLYLKGTGLSERGRKPERNKYLKILKHEGNQYHLVLSSGTFYFRIGVAGMGD